MKREVITFEMCETIFGRIVDVDESIEELYEVYVKRYVQARWHKKKRINKKWIKRYGYIMTVVPLATKK